MIRASRNEMQEKGDWRTDRSQNAATQLNVDGAASNPNVFPDQTALLASRLRPTLAKIAAGVKALQQQPQQQPNLIQPIAQQARQSTDHDLIRAKVELAQVQADLVKAQAHGNALMDANAHLEQQLQALKRAAQQAVQQALWQAKQESDDALSQAKAAFAQAQAQADLAKTQADRKALVDLNAQIEQQLQAQQTAAQQAKEGADNALAQAQADLAKAQADRKALVDLNAQIEQQLQAQQTAAQQAKEGADNALAQVQAELEKLNKAEQQNKAKLDDTTQENELLLLQLMQAQEELVEYFDEKVKFEKLYGPLRARWERLVKRYPGYVDFGGVELVAVDNVSEIPSVTWHVRDFAQGDTTFDEILFQTVLQDGHPGIGLVSSLKASAEEPALVPMLLKPQSRQLERFTHMGQNEFRQIQAAAAILAQIEAANWQNVTVPGDVDPAFWRPSLKLLAAQVQALPAMLRFDTVRLKRELINPEYEHLWLEFKGLSLGARIWPQFELRLGAALVQPGGFSQFPKFEFPLIDGKTKPFDSWYAESHDDHGAKLELRFALEKKSFDTTVWAKLDDTDRALLLRIIYAMPDVLKRLEAEKAMIQRPWATWVDFAQGAVQVMEGLRVAGQTKKSSDAAAAIEESAATPVNQTAAGPTVINIGAKPASKTASPKAAAPVKTTAAAK